MAYVTTKIKMFTCFDYTRCGFRFTVLIKTNTVIHSVPMAMHVNMFYCNMISAISLSNDAADKIYCPTETYKKHEILQYCQ
jgi:hypothetical protein